MNPVLEFACTDETLEKLEAALADAPEILSYQRLVALLPLAWQLRQRDTTRALLLADEAEACFALSDLAAGERLSIAARLCLIRAEAKWLFGELEEGAALAENALRDFTACNDAIGCADVHWLLAHIALDQGAPARPDTELAAMAASAQANDPVRLTVAQARRAIFAAYHDLGGGFFCRHRNAQRRVRRCHPALWHLPHASTGYGANPAGNLRRNQPRQQFQHPQRPPRRA
jgi:hypothetical protein